MQSCAKCPQGKYVNTTGTVSDAKCNRCPDGKFGPEAGKSTLQVGALHHQVYLLFDTSD